MATKFKIGDLVWAKMKGFPAWPGKVIEPKPEVKRPASDKKQKQFVFFFGSENYAWITEDTLWHYMPYKEKYTVTSRIPKGFKEAQEAMDDALKANPEQSALKMSDLPSIDEELDQIFPSSPAEKDKSKGKMEVSKDKLSLSVRHEQCAIDDVKFEQCFARRRLRKLISKEELLIPNFKVTSAGTCKLSKQTDAGHYQGETNYDSFSKCAQEENVIKDNSLVKIGVEGTFYKSDLLLGRTKAKHISHVHNTTSRSLASSVRDSDSMAEQDRYLGVTTRSNKISSAKSVNASTSGESRNSALADIRSGRSHDEFPTKKNLSVDTDSESKKIAGRIFAVGVTTRSRRSVKSANDDCPLSAAIETKDYERGKDSERALEHSTAYLSKLNEGFINSPDQKSFPTNGDIELQKKADISYTLGVTTRSRRKSEVTSAYCSRRAVVEIEDYQRSFVDPHCSTICSNPGRPRVSCSLGMTTRSRKKLKLNKLHYPPGAALKVEDKLDNSRGNSLTENAEKYSRGYLILCTDATIDRPVGKTRSGRSYTNQDLFSDIWPSYVCPYESQVAFVDHLTASKDADHTCKGVDMYELESTHGKHNLKTYGKRGLEGITVKKAARDSCLEYDTSKKNGLKQTGSNNLVHSKLNEKDMISKEGKDTITVVDLSEDICVVDDINHNCENILIEGTEEDNCNGKVTESDLQYCMSFENYKSQDNANRDNSDGGEGMAIDHSSQKGMIVDDSGGQHIASDDKDKEKDSSKSFLNRHMLITEKNSFSIPLSSCIKETNIELEGDCMLGDVLSRTTTMEASVDTCFDSLEDASSVKEISMMNKEFEYPEEKLFTDEDATGGQPVAVVDNKCSSEFYSFNKEEPDTSELSCANFEEIVKGCTDELVNNVQKHKTQLPKSIGALPDRQEGTPICPLDSKSDNECDDAVVEKAGSGGASQLLLSTSSEEDVAAEALLFVSENLGPEYAAKLYQQIRLACNIPDDSSGESDLHYANSNAEDNTSEQNDLSDCIPCVPPLTKIEDDFCAADDKSESCNDPVCSTCPICTIVCSTVNSERTLLGSQKKYEQSHDKNDYVDMSFESEQRKCAKDMKDKNVGKQQKMDIAAVRAKEADKKQKEPKSANMTKTKIQQAPKTPKMSKEPKITKSPKSAKKRESSGGTPVPPKKFKKSSKATPLRKKVSQNDEVKSRESRSFAREYEDQLPPMSGIDPYLTLPSFGETSPAKNIIPTPMKIGFLGLGIMGSGMVHNLLKSGHEVTVWNRTPSKCREFVKEGALKGNSPAEVVMQCDMTFSCVSDPPALKDLVFGNCGVLQGIGQGKAYIDMSTVDIETIQDINEAVTARGGRFLESPVIGSRQPSSEGQLLIMAAGDRSLYDDCFSCFQSMSKQTFFLGEVGSATKMKLVMTCMMGTVLAGLSEVLALAEKVGLDQEDVLKIMQLSPISCAYVRTKGYAMLNSHYNDPQCKLQVYQKDLRLAVNLSDTVDQSLIVGSAVNELFKKAKAKGYGEHDSAAVYRAAAL